MHNALILRRIHDIHRYLDGEVWASTRKDADAYEWYGISADDHEGHRIIQDLREHVNVVEGEYSVILPDGTSGKLFGVQRAGQRTEDGNTSATRQ